MKVTIPMGRLQRSTSKPTGNKLAKQFLDVESDVRDICCAVKVVSCVVSWPTP
jgi:hypothetical protein